MEWKLERNDPRQAKEFFEKKMRFTLGPAEVEYYKDHGVPMNIIDVRHAEDYDKGHIPGAVSLPEERWESLEGLSKDKPNVVYCYTVVCHLAAKAAVFFADKGFPVHEMDGGFEAWKDYGLKVERAMAGARSR